MYAVLPDLPKPRAVESRASGGRRPPSRSEVLQCVHSRVVWLNQYGSFDWNGLEMKDDVRYVLMHRTFETMTSGGRGSNSSGTAGTMGTEEIWQGGFSCASSSVTTGMKHKLKASMIRAWLEY